MTMTHGEATALEQDNQTLSPSVCITKAAEVLELARRRVEQGCGEGDARALVDVAGMWRILAESMAHYGIKGARQGGAGQISAGGDGVTPR